MARLLWPLLAVLAVVVAAGMGMRAPERPLEAAAATPVPTTPTPFDPVNYSYQRPLPDAAAAAPQVTPGPKPNLPQVPCSAQVNMVRSLTQAELCGGTLNGSLAGHANVANVYRTDPPCAACHDANESVYTVDIAQPLRFGAGMRGFSNGPFGLFLLDDTCHANNIVGGSDSMNTGMQMLDPGRYFLVVDTWTLNAGFQLSTACTFAAPKASLPALPTNGTPVTGNNSSGQNRVAWYGTHPLIGGACPTTSGQNAPEVVYTLDVDQTRRVDLRLDIQGSADLNLFLLSEYDNLDCVARSVSSSSPESVGKVLEPGRYYVVVDGAYGSTANYSLRATLGSPTTSPRVVAEPTALACNSSVRGDTRGRTNRVTNYSCLTYGLPEPEVAYRFDIGVTTTIQLHMTPTAIITPQLNLDLLLLKSDSPNSCINISNNRKDLNYPPDPEWINRTLAPGSYYAVVDGPAGTQWSYDLTLACQSERGDPTDPDCARVDLDGDGTVTAADLATLAGRWPGSGPDLTGDGRFDVVDLAWASRFWNRNCYAAP